MNKTNCDIIKSIKLLNTETFAKYKKFLKDLKKKNIIVFDCWDWNRPCMTDFHMYGNDAKLYIKSLDCNRVKHIGQRDIADLIDDPANFTFVTADELKKFKTVTYPKLYAKWHEEQKRVRAQKRADNAKNADKIRTKIAKLQHQLDNLN